MSAGSTCGKQESKFSYILKSNGKDRQDYHVFADTKISSVSGTHKNQLLIFQKLNKIRNMDALNIKAVGRVFTAGVCVWTLIQGRGAQTVYMFNYPHLLDDPFSPVHQARAMYQFGIFYCIERQVKPVQFLIHGSITIILISFSFLGPNLILHSAILISRKIHFDASPP